jgi:hypothetical protein
VTPTEQRKPFMHATPLVPFNEKEPEAAYLSKLVRSKMNAAKLAEPATTLA